MTKYSLPIRGQQSVVPGSLGKYQVNTFDGNSWRCTDVKDLIEARKMLKTHLNDLGLTKSPRAIPIKHFPVNSKTNHIEWIC